MIRVAYLADLHFLLGPTWDEGLRVHTWIADDLERRAAQRQGPDLIVLLGDLFHASPRPAELLAAVEFVLRLASTAEVVILRGNHDPPRLLDLFAHLDAAHPIHVYDAPSVHTSRGIALAVLPWLDHVGPPPDEHLPDEARKAAEQSALRAIFDGLAADLGQHCPPHVVPLFAGHFTLRGAIPQIGQPERRGWELEVSLDDLARVGAVHYALGHIHAAQRWQVGAFGRWAEYVGSSRRTTFGEVEDKRYLLLQVHGGEVESVPVPVPAAPMLLAESAWEKGGWKVAPETIVAAVREAAEKAGPGVVPEVRFAYHVAAEESAAARLAMGEVREAVEALGARFVPAPKVIATRPVRSPSIARASSLAEKVALYLRDVKRMDDAAPMRAMVLSALGEVETALDLRRGPAAAGGAELRRLSMRGFGIYREETVLDLATLPGELVGVVGDNGQGKSTLFAARAAALYRRIPTATDTYRLGAFAKREGYLEAVVGIGGEPWRIRHDFGPNKAYVYRPDGGLVDDRGLVPGFERWAAEHLLPLSVFTGAVYAVQTSAGIPGLKRSKRREVLLRAIGDEALEKVSKAAKERADKASRALADLAARIDAKKHETAYVAADLPAQVAQAREALTLADQALAAAREADRAWQAAEAERRARQGAVERHRAAVATLDRLQAQRVEIEATIADAEAIRSAAERLTIVQADVAQIEARKREADARCEAERRLMGEHERTRRAVEDRIRALRRTTETAETKIAERGPVDAAVAALPTLAAQVERAEATLAEAEEALAAIRAAAATANDTRIAALRGGHADVQKARSLLTAHTIAGAALKGDAATLAARGPDAVQAGEERVATARQAIATAQTAHATARSTASLLRFVEEAEKARGEALVALAREEQVATEAQTAWEQAEAAYDVARREAQQAETALFPLRARSRELAPVAARSEALARAEGSLAALAKPIEDAEDAVQRAADALPTDAPTPPLPRPDVAALEADVRRHMQTLAQREERARVLAAATATLAEYTAQRTAAEDEVTRWMILAAATGKEGIQALEIDAACPAISEVGTNLLHGSFGDQWTMRIDTADESEDGEERQVLRITVIDAVEDREADIATYSPGQMAFLGCAFSLALAAFVCGRVGATAPTLFLDEAGGGVSPERTEPYVTMIRRGARAIGAGKVLLVTHSPACQALTDVAIRVDRGRLTLTTPTRS